MRLARFLSGVEVLSGVISGDTIRETGGKSRVFDVSKVKLLAPVLPSKIVSVGLNYKDHAAELEMAVPAAPIIFLKPSTAVIGPGDTIIYPASSNRVDFEAELGIVIKSLTKNVPVLKAKDHIAGYTCVNDVTARDLQKIDGQWTRSKAFDTFAPIGPWIETELDVSGLYVRSFLNGKLKQDSRTSEFIFGVPELVSFISFVMTLLPGDIIATGTPANIGPMLPGDEITVEVEGIGKLTNRVARNA